MDTERFRHERPPTAEDQTVYTARGSLRVPLDLSKWVAPDKILFWVRELLQKLDYSKPEVLEYGRLQREFRPEVLLTLLLYSYATEVFASDDIVQACRSETMQQQICGGQAPFGHELEQFRRKHRGLIENLLAEILLRAVREKYTNVPLPPGVEYSILTRALDRLDTARRLDDLES